ncbi:MAG TPA: biotin--[acetyl-CoA-carboxylase] ligase [Mycobacterium sp.]|nr:biotin--[acetyl-CoA-carboxylase] ligase [Mycobacterium sp.]
MDRDKLRSRLHATTLRQELAGPERPWRYLEVVDETGSTNSDLLARAAAGEDIDGVVLIAEHQTAGRGRMGRSWSAAPRAQITLSVGVRPGDVPIDHWGWLPLATGVAVVDTVAAEAGVHAGLKWPNDVMVDDRKLAGIFSEVAEPKTLVVIGIGLNVTLSAEEAGDPVAVSLLDVGVAALDRDRLVRRLLSELGRRIVSWRRAGGVDEQLIADYRARSMTIGSEVRAVLPGDRKFIGTARAIDREGRLIIDCAGKSVAVSAGDIVHLRPRDKHGL